MGVADQLAQYENSDEHRAYVMVNLWRPVLPMTASLQDRPLAFIDPTSVDCEQDFIAIDLVGQLPGGQRYLNLKQNPLHRWYYYPDMTTSEVLVWKQSHFMKEEGQSFTTSSAQTNSLTPVPHSAASIPGTPEDCEARCSFELRVGLLCSTPDGQPATA
ncbi:unnamed protein product [Polarella glacialis]|nr:unnamed protein product [Polarella glacialis]